MAQHPRTNLAPRCSLTISCVLCRQPDVHDQHNRLRAKTSRKLWTAEEDAVLYDHSDRELPTRPYVAGKTDHAVRMRMQHLGLSLPTAPFPTAIFDPEAPPLLLDYSTWTPINPALSIPPEAEVDWANACARIPRQWPLALSPDCRGVGRCRALSGHCRATVGPLSA